MAERNEQAGIVRWDDLLLVERDCFARIIALWNKLPNKEEVLIRALQSPEQRVTALRLLLVLGEDDLKKKAFAALVKLASAGHGDIGICRTLIKSMPRDWVQQNLEVHARPVLEGPDPGEEYRRIAELYAEIDRSLLRRHVDGALRHPDPEVREVGTDFEKSLQNHVVPGN
jgi:hypothetical protein